MKSMRDATIDHRAVKLPNASTLGYGQWKARRGDLIVYRETYTDGSFACRTGRVLGRVAYAPPLTGEYAAPAVKNHLYVLAFADNLTYAYIRWIDPAEVLECIPCTADVRRFLAILLDPKVPADLPDLANYGIHADLTDDNSWPVETRVAKRREERTARNLTIDRAGLVNGWNY